MNNIGEFQVIDNKVYAIKKDTLGNCSLCAGETRTIRPGALCFKLGKCEGRIAVHVKPIIKHNPYSLAESWTCESDEYDAYVGVDTTTIEAYNNWVNAHVDEVKQYES